LHIKAPISLRVNPNVDAQTHPYISTGLKENKFGISILDALKLYQKANDFDWIELIGIDCHIGSQLTQLAPFLEAFDHLLALVDKLASQGIYLQHIDIGGGVGITYQDEPIFPLTQYAESVLHKLGKRKLNLIMEPGRALVGSAGVLLTRVEYLKVNEGKHFAVVDAAMTELMRPALYQAWHDITVLNPTAEITHTYDIVGPVCESADFLGKSRTLALKEGDLLLIHHAGAYASSMGSSYNSRPLVPEVMVDELGTARLVRSRETYQHLLANEINCLPNKK
jgi:diaminopimelate decarboxylase